MKKEKTVKRIAKPFGKVSFLNKNKMIDIIYGLQETSEMDFYQFPDSVNHLLNYNGEVVEVVVGGSMFRQAQPDHEKFAVGVLFLIPDPEDTTQLIPHSEEYYYVYFKRLLDMDAGKNVEDVTHLELCLLRQFTEFATMGRINSFKRRYPPTAILQAGDLNDRS